MLKMNISFCIANYSKNRHLKPKNLGPVMSHNPTLMELPGRGRLGFRFIGNAMNTTRNEIIALVIVIIK